MYLIQSSPRDTASSTELDHKIRPSSRERAQSLQLASVSEKPVISILDANLTGIVLAGCFGKLGFKVICADHSREKVNSLNAGAMSIEEDGLAELIFAGNENSKLSATSDYSHAVANSNITFLVSEGDDAITDLEDACREAASAIKSSPDYHLFIVCSNVPVGTTANKLIPLLSEISGKEVGADFGLCYVPTLLRNGTAIESFLHPSIKVIGAVDQRSIDFAERIFDGVSGEVIPTTLETAEMFRSVLGAWLTLKAGFGNEIGRLCKALNLDSHDVMNIFLKHEQQTVPSANLKPVFTFGGAEFSDSYLTLQSLAEENKVEAPILSSMERSNSAHRRHLLRLIEEQAKKRIGFIGICPGPGRDSHIDSPTLQLIRELIFRGYSVSFYDPQVNERTRLDSRLEENCFLHSRRCYSEEELLTTSECLVITHYRNYAHEILRKAGSHVSVIDAVRVIGDPATRASYQGICW